MPDLAVSLITDLLSSLLPYDIQNKKHEDLKKLTHEYLFLISVLIESMEDFNNRNFKNFDALVGENACQIRAVKIICIYENSTVNCLALINRACQIQETIKNLEKISDFFRLMPQKTTFYDLLKMYNLNLTLCSDAIFLVRAWLLTKAKKISSNFPTVLNLCLTERIDPKNIQNMGEISYSFADKLLSKSKKSLSLESVNFIKNYASTSGDLSLQANLSNKYTILHNGYLTCIPMFWTYKAILKLIDGLKVPVILKCHLLKKDGERKQVFISSTEDQNKCSYFLDKPIFVVEGVALIDEVFILNETDWKNIILKYSTSDIILAAAADHRQYPDQNFDGLFELYSDLELQFFKKMASNEGFSLKNPSKFFIRHVYCQTLKELILMS